ncbi:MAG TPA: tRNA uridine-5-carboxymethylaminomethyl(34) synthesis GTPase MnmE [Firmicutes bacterium]|nr:tRNA uridine-5-carboxymethylaminomethyl(34) synthesis GTPase MnmE [Bacillota bacterium]
MADTIAAIATGNALAAIGIVRLSGDSAIDVADRVFFPADGGRMSEKADRKLVYGELRDGGRALDLCLCTISRAPNSYTGEDTAELQLHGSPVVLGECLRLLFENGARQALAGEFTKRAFLNGRMDLTQAEAVVDLIDAETPEAAFVAADQLGGTLLRGIDGIYSDLTDIMSHFHAVLDYPDEDIGEFELAAYAGRLAEIEARLTALLATFERGRVLRAGVRCAMIGRPNVGKSSILNALLGYDRAIVTDVPGTTRDTIEEKLRLGRVLLRLTDTAGLRPAGDVVESIGVERSLAAAREAELVIAVFDGSSPLTEGDMAVISAAGGKERRIALINKSDLPQKLDEAHLRESFEHVLRVSALRGEGFDGLERVVGDMYPSGEGHRGAMLTNERQADAVSRARESVGAALSAVDAGMTPDAALCEVEAAMSALGELTGRTVRDDITARIFERFCVGK